MFKDLIDKIKTYEWSEIKGKNLKIITSKDTNCEIIAGQDIKTGEIYLIASKYIKEDKLQ